MTETADILVAKGLHKYYGNGLSRVHVLRGVDLTVRRGEFLAIMGPSGCGKSTLLHILGLMMTADNGQVLLNGEVLPSDDRARTLIRRAEIGFVFQRFNLLSVLSAADNVAISLRVRGMNVNGRIQELFERLAITRVANHKPGAMSIGEQQRVAVARALAHRPALVLADEPTGNLDSANGKALLDLFRQVNREEKQTIVMITHSAEAGACADRVLQMKDGRILDQR